ncbi:MAG: prolipoprotein diacylglyceryl transferase [bacterium]|nr:prolipoprotein diacylglyceryl transferase [bacterium]
MQRTLIDLPQFGVVVSGYGGLLALAAAVCLLVGPWWAARLEGLDRRAVRRALLLVAVAPWIGGRLHFVLNNWALFAERPSRMLALTDGGLHAAGAILALALALPLGARWAGVPLLRLADGLTPMVGIGVAIARIGCFLNGCCFGTPCDHGWCVRFPSDTFVFRQHLFSGLLPPRSTMSLPVHPLQLYFAAVGLLVAIVGMRVHRRKRFDGQVALVGLVIFSVGAAALETLRANAAPRTYWGPLPALEWVALGMTAASLAVLVFALAQWGVVGPGSAIPRHRAASGRSSGESTRTQGASHAEV